MGEYTLKELADAAGKKERTVRYYQQLGLLRQPGQIGPGAHYTDEDRLRLQIIGQLQAEGKSLTEIATHLGTLDATGIREEALRHGSALDYVRSVLGAATPETNAMTSSLATTPASSQLSLLPRAAPTAQWKRIEVAPGIELHVRHPISPARRRAISAYIDRARNDLEGIN